MTLSARHKIIKLISNLKIPINAKAKGEGINQNSRVAKKT